MWSSLSVGRSLPAVVGRSLGRIGQLAVSAATRPPSTRTSQPLMNRARGPARNAIASAMSAVRPGNSTDPVVLGCVDRRPPDEPPLARVVLQLELSHGRVDEPRGNGEDPGAPSTPGEQRIAGTAGRRRASPTRTPSPDRARRPSARSTLEARSDEMGSSRTACSLRRDRQQMRGDGGDADRHGTRSGGLSPDRRGEQPFRRDRLRGSALASSIIGRDAGEVHQAVAGRPRPRSDARASRIEAREPRSATAHIGLGSERPEPPSSASSSMSTRRSRLAAEPFDAGPAHAASGARDDGHAQCSSSTSGVTSRSCLRIPALSGSSGH